MGCVKVRKGREGQKGEGSGNKEKHTGVGESIYLVSTQAG